VGKKPSKKQKKDYIGLLFEGVPVRKAASQVGCTYGEISKASNKDAEFRDDIRNALKLATEEILQIERLLLESATLGITEITEHYRAIRDSNNNYIKDNDGNNVFHCVGRDIRHLPPDIKAQEIVLKAYLPEQYCDHNTITVKSESPEDIKQKLLERLSELK